MEEADKRLWDVRLGSVAPLLTVVGILIGVWQYNDGEENRREEEHAALVQKDNLDYQRQIWTQKMETYQAVVGLAGKVAFASQGQDRDQAVRSFETAYWSAMILVQDAAVERAMMDFHYELHNLANGLSKGDRLQVRSAVLAKACQDSLRTSARALGASAAPPAAAARATASQPQETPGP